jgi:hypothetical protein
MDDFCNRDQFLDDLDIFCNSVELTGTFLNSLRNYKSFSRNMKTVDVLYSLNLPKQKIFNFFKL